MLPSLDKVAQAASSLKVFPLPNVVMFPGGVQPLHVFEPRYREMIADCLAGDRVLAVATLAPGWEEAGSAPPAIRPVCCAGFIVWHQELSDGRLNIIVQGVARARMMSELPSPKPYRLLVTQVLEDKAYVGPAEDLLRQAVLELSGQAPGPGAQALLQYATRSSGGALADLVASALVYDVERRQTLLEQFDVGQRLRDVLADVGELIARTGPVPVPGRLN